MYIARDIHVHSDTKRAIESDRIDGVFVLSRLNLDIRAFFPQGPNKLSVIMRYPY